MIGVRGLVIGVRGAGDRCERGLVIGVRRAGDRCEGGW